MIITSDVTFPQFSESVTTGYWIPLDVQMGRSHDLLQVKVNSVPLSVKIDSRAEVSAAPMLLFSSISRRLERVDKVLMGLSEQQPHVLGNFFTKLRWKDEVTQQVFYVVEPTKHMCSALLDLPVIEFWA